MTPHEGHYKDDANHTAKNRRKAHRQKVAKMDSSPMTAGAKAAFLQVEIIEEPVDARDQSWDCAQCATTVKAPNPMVWIELNGVGNWAVCPPCWEEIKAKSSSQHTASIAKVREAVEAKIKGWEELTTKHPGVLHEASGIIAAWVEMRQIIDAALTTPQVQSKEGTT